MKKAVPIVRFDKLHINDTRVTPAQKAAREAKRTSGTDEAKIKSFLKAMKQSSSNEVQSIREAKHKGDIRSAMNFLDQLARSGIIETKKESHKV
ncbi:MAG: hypothetical protein RLZZ361_1437 [Cyanobacteriota bacterium]|jgi:ribosomal protein S20